MSTDSQQHEYTCIDCDSGDMTRTEARRHQRHQRHESHVVVEFEDGN